MAGTVITYDRGLTHRVSLVAGTVITYDRGLTHRVSLVIGGHSGPTADAYCDFVPDDSSFTETRNIVETATCKKCYGSEFHGHAREPASPADTPAQLLQATKNILAMVNGTPMSEVDVRCKLMISRHRTKATPQHRKNVFRSIIREELIYQRALELGLDAAPTYRENLCRMEARMKAFRRHELGKVFFRREIARKAHVSEAEAKKYFAENAPRIRTELHVWQILLKGEEGPIQQALRDIEHGKSFEEVAKRRFPKLPETGRKPWDLGYLRWKRVPKPWRNVVYDLNIGQVSGVIRGPGQRFWIIKLVNKRENPSVGFASIKPTIMEILKSEKIEERLEKTRRDLRDKASIVHFDKSSSTPTE